MFSGRGVGGQSGNGEFLRKGSECSNAWHRERAKEYSSISVGYWLQQGERWAVAWREKLGRSPTTFWTLPGSSFFIIYRAKGIHWRIISMTDKLDWWFRKTISYRGCITGEWDWARDAREREGGECSQVTKTWFLAIFL